MTDPNLNLYEIELERERRRRSRAEFLLLVFGIVALVGGKFGYGVADGYRLEAARLDSIADLREGEAFAVRERARALELRLRADSAALADSVARWGRERAADSVAVEEATAEAEAIASSIEERVDEATAALFVGYRARRDSIDARLRADTRRERARANGLEVQLSTLTAVSMTKDTTIALGDSTTAALRSAIAVRDREISSRRRELRLLKLGGVVLLGAAIFERVAR